MKTPCFFFWMAALLPTAPTLAQSPYAHDLAVTHIYALDKVAQADAAPQVVRARVVNRGTQNVSTGLVQLRITGANTLTRIASLPYLAAGRAAVVSFGSYQPGNLGRQRLSARVPTDDNPTNDSVSVAQVVSPDTASYITPGVPSFALPGQFLFGRSPSGPGNRFAVGNTPRQVQAVRAYVTHPYSVGLLAVGFVADLVTGRVLGRSTQRVLSQADINQFVTFDIIDDMVLQNCDYLAGYAIITRVGPPVPYEPPTWGYQLDVPQRSEVTYGVCYDVTGNTPLVPPYDCGDPRLAAPDSSAGKFMAEVITTTPPACARPANLQVVVRGGPFRVEFDSVFNAVGYDVAYGPTAGLNINQVTATGGTIVQQRRGPFWLTAAVPDVSYTFYVRARCAGGGVGAWAGPLDVRSPCTPPVTQLPYREPFDALLPGQSWPCGSQALDADGNRTTWAVVNYVYNTTPSGLANLYTSAPNALFLDELNGHFPAGGAADDWFFTPALPFQAGHRYRLTFNYRGENAINNPDKLAVWLGDAPDPARQTVPLFRNPHVSTLTYIPANAGTTPAVQDIVVPTSGSYYLGFQAFSQMATTITGNGRLLLIDDIAVDEVTATPTRAEALAQQLRLYPNPSADGHFVVELPDAAGAGPWALRVSNAVGQVVAEADSWAAGAHPLDLSGRPAGLYVVRLCGPQGCVTRRLLVGP